MNNENNEKIKRETDGAPAIPPDDSGTKPRAQRITLLRAGKPKRKFILIDPPFAEIGDVCELQGESWVVVAVQETTILLHVTE